MYKFLIASCLAVASLASPEADAEAGVPAWPSIRGYGLQSTCYGCRPYPIVPVVHAIGKRKAEAEPEADPYYGYGYGYSRLGYGHRLGYYGHGLGYYGRGYRHGYGYGYYG